MSARGISGGDIGDTIGFGIAMRRIRQRFDDMEDQIAVQQAWLAYYAMVAQAQFADPSSPWSNDPSAGWYADPSTGQMRWCNAQRSFDHGPPPIAPPPIWTPPPRAPSRKGLVLTILVVWFLFMASAAAGRHGLPLGIAADTIIVLAYWRHRRKKKAPRISAPKPSAPWSSTSPPYPPSTPQATGEQSALVRAASSKSKAS